MVKKLSAAGSRYLSVRRQGFWDRWRRDLREGLSHLVGLIMRRICGEENAALRWSFERASVATIVVSVVLQEAVADCPPGNGVQRRLNAPPSAQHCFRDMGDFAARGVFAPSKRTLFWWVFGILVLRNYE